MVGKTKATNGISILVSLTPARFKRSKALRSRSVVLSASNDSAKGVPRAIEIEILFTNSFMAAVGFLSQRAASSLLKLWPSDTFLRKTCSSLATSELDLEATLSIAECKD